MTRGYTQAEAEALVNQSFETHRFLGDVPRGTRGQVIQALDQGDHWNVLIEWSSLRLASRVWYDKFDVQHSMRALRRGAGEGEAEAAILEIRSSHDLTAPSPDARRTGAHSYPLDYRGLVAELRSWLKDRRRSAVPLCLMTLNREQIWISRAEGLKLVAALESALRQVVVD